jgi:hypothetical protein
MRASFWNQFSIRISDGRPPRWTLNVREKFPGGLTAEEEATAYFVRSHIAHASAIRQNQMIDPPIVPLITPKKNLLPASYPATSAGS